MLTPDMLNCLIIVILVVLISYVLFMMPANNMKPKHSRCGYRQGLDSTPPTTATPIDASAVIAPSAVASSTAPTTVTPALTTLVATTVNTLSNQDLPTSDDMLEFNKQIALEPSVFDSHRKFVHEMPHRTTVASMDVQRTDRNDVNPWTGIRPIRYNDTIARSQSESRVVESDIPEQMPEYKKYVIA